MFNLDTKRKKLIRIENLIRENNKEQIERDVQIQKSLENILVEFDGINKEIRTIVDAIIETESKCNNVITQNVDTVKDMLGNIYAANENSREELYASLNEVLNSSKVSSDELASLIKMLVVNSLLDNMEGKAFEK